MSRRPHLIPSLIAALFLIACLGDWPYGYYMVLRVVVCGAAVFVAHLAYAWCHLWATWTFGVMAALFNPLLPVHLFREAWLLIDVGAAVLFVVAAIVVRRRSGASRERTGRAPNGARADADSRRV